MVGNRLGVRCDVFDIRLERIESGDAGIEYRFWTDLPAGTTVSLECFRKYVDYADREQLWLMISTELVIEAAVHGDFNGGRGFIPVNASDQKALDRFEEMLVAMSKGIKTPPGDEITVSLIVGAGQRLRAFGQMNKNLTGAMVQDSGGVRAVVVDDRVIWPMDKRFSPLAPDSQQPMGPDRNRPPKKVRSKPR